MSGMIKSTWCC